MQPAARIPGTELPLCRHFGTCGGCDALDRPIHDQLDRKLARVRELLAPYVTAEQVSCAPPPVVPLHHRTKLLYPVRPDDRGRPQLGIYARGTHDLVEIEECRTQDKRLTRLGRAVAGILADLRLHPFDERDGSGFVRAFHARLAPGTGELIAGLVTAPGLFPQGKDFAEALTAAARKLPRAGRQRTELVGVMRAISERTDNFLLGEKHVPLKGRDHVIDRQGGIRFRIGMGSFYQVHRAAHQVLYGPAMELAGDVGGQRVVDGYGGVGTFGLRFAKAGAKRVEIVEDNPSACRDAAHNAKANKLSGVVVERASFPESEFAPGADLLLVDPPRSGLREAGVERVLAAAPRRLVYVACSPTALAQDLAALTENGWRLREARVCDMFPHTDHVEVVAALDRA
jgi:23S rRNA (uracil1939-C5)-methyltransferase